MLSNRRRSDRFTIASNPAQQRRAPLPLTSGITDLKDQLLEWPARLWVATLRDTRQTMAGKKKARRSPTTRRPASSNQGVGKKPVRAKKTTKRKPVAVKKKAVKKKAVKKKAVKKKAVGHVGKSSTTKTTRKKKRATTGSTSPSKARGATKTSSLGRPKVTGEEKLFLLFKQDYHARQVFSFLGVETVKELEQFEPDQIIKLLSQPIRQAVQQIRAKLAENNRSLRGDKDFALRLKERKKG